jgi:ABC transporter substrate binding protein (PQQ-dependent alcohol dehydrogenase system)
MPVLVALLALAVPGLAPRAAELQIDILYLRQDIALPPVLSNRIPEAANSGPAGAGLGIADSNTTGRFLKHTYALTVERTDDAQMALAIAREAIADGRRLIILDTPLQTTLSIARHADIRRRALLFNVGSRDDELRSASCTTGLLHTRPSRAMLGDALGQFLVARRWSKWLILRGGRPEDLAWERAFERAAKRFGARIVDSREWSFDTDLRRTAQQELPLFTQARDYDVTLVADEIGDVGEFVPYNTWLPRPVAGTQGLTPRGWDSVVEQWGAQQLQNRFEEREGRGMSERDYAAWAAVRSIAEAVTRRQSTDPATLYAYLLSDDFEIAAFKGRSLSYRTWNGQLRQPIALVQPRAVVSQSPQEGFLHPRTELDTLGYDAPETRCDFEKTL